MSKNLLTILGAIVLVTSFAASSFANETDQQPVVQGDPRFTRVLVSGDSIVQAQPDTGCVFWECEPGADDEGEVPIASRAWISRTESRADGRVIAILSYASAKPAGEP